jgi:hypothetical protein
VVFLCLRPREVEGRQEGHRILLVGPLHSKYFQWKRTADVPTAKEALRYSVKWPCDDESWQGDSLGRKDRALGPSLSETPAERAGSSRPGGLRAAAEAELVFCCHLLSTCSGKAPGLCPPPF